MQYADKTLTCRACGATFVFTSGEQAFYASRGFDNEPARCPPCRAARKADRPTGSLVSTTGYTASGYATSGRRDFFTTTCGQCGREARVPFQPRGDKPVYCRDCYAQEPRRNSY